MKEKPAKIDDLDFYMAPEDEEEGSGGGGNRTMVGELKSK
jgi:hypothetical protein